jgi:hypothetical protein
LTPSRTADDARASALSAFSLAAFPFSAFFPSAFFPSAFSLAAFFLVAFFVTAFARPVPADENAPANAPANAASTAVAELIAAAVVPPELRAAMTAAVRTPSRVAKKGADHDSPRQWSGTATVVSLDSPDAGRVGGAAGKGEWLFGLAARPLPEGQLRNRATPILVSTAQAIAIHEMLTARAVLDAYAAQGLTDLVAVRQALLRVAGEIRVTGKVRGTLYQAEARGGFAVSFVAGHRDTLTAYLRDPPTLALVRHAYRDVLTDRVRESTRMKAWREALATVDHLDKLELVTGPLLLDATRCHEGLGAGDLALSALKRARRVDDARASVDFLTELGDVALRLGGDEAQAVAEEAFTEALRRFRNR